ncbi:MAG: hypothetical protein KKD44_26195 [Proteobacteria bacterium]|nr:hypothetical protein [Pseudomonadota bacterium]
MKVIATVILPAYVVLDVPEDTSLEKIKALILEQADYIYASCGIDAIIQDSNIPELND